MQSVSDAPHTEQRCFAFPIPATTKASTALYTSGRRDAIDDRWVETVCAEEIERFH
jgi:hypothetical protein